MKDLLKGEICILWDDTSRSATGNLSTHFWCIITPDFRPGEVGLILNKTLLIIMHSQSQALPGDDLTPTSSPISEILY